MEHLQKNITNIYSCLADDTSRRIYANRLLYSLTGDKKYLQNVIRITAEGREFTERLKDHRRKIIFGAGAWGKEIVNAYADVQFVCFVDNQKAGGKLLGLPVISFQEYVKQYRDDLAIIATRLYYEQFYRQLKEHGIPEQNIINIGKAIDELSKKQYFDLPELKSTAQSKENFVDAGSLDGRTSILFSKWAKEKCGKIWALEPEAENAVCCRKNLLESFGGGYIRYEVIQKGLWDCKKQMSFVSGSKGASRIEDTGNSTIEVDRLDAILPEEEPVTFIKMDLEGAELHALQGAEQTIRRYRPKLAVSIYHKPEDIWEIPEMILKLHPDYRLYLRHYSIAAAETVVYAI